MRCNRVMASSTCHCHHQPIRSHLVQTRGSALTAAPPGDRTDCERAAGPAGHVMSISEDRRGCELQSKSPRECSEGVVWLDAITQHERCDHISRHAGGTSYSVTGKTARITGITVRATCRAVLPAECLIPLPSLLRKKLGRRSVAAVVRTGRSLPVVTQKSSGGSCRARRSRWLVGRAAAQRSAAQRSAASEQARQTS
jgi:hypothetical protein